MVSVKVFCYVRFSFGVLRNWSFAAERFCHEEWSIRRQAWSSVLNNYVRPVHEGGPGLHPF